MTEQKPDAPNETPKEARLEPRKKSDEEKQKEKDAMINLWMGGVAQDQKELDKDK